MYGLLYTDAPDGHLFAHPLGGGASCATSLVLPIASDGVGTPRVRKFLNPAGTLRQPGVSEAEFNQDASVARELHDAAHHAGRTLLIPPVLADSVTLAGIAAGARRGPRVSYWGLCNGGTLLRFIVSCASARVAPPCGLLLRFLQQALETLEFMHSALDVPVFHHDLHTENLMLHFAPGQVFPDLYVIDFGRATRLPAMIVNKRGRRRCPCGDRFCQCQAWDVPHIQCLIREDLLPLLLPEDFSGEVMDERDTPEAYPLRTAFEMLGDLHDEFCDRATAYSRGESASFEVPSLQPVIDYLRVEAARSLLGVQTTPEGKAFWRKVLVPTCAAAERLNRTGPHLALSKEDLDRVAGQVPLPWIVAEVDVDADGTVVGVPGPVPLGPGNTKGDACVGESGNGS